LNSQKARSSHNPYQTVGLGVLLVGTLSLLLITVPTHTFFWKAVNNSGHVPLFMVVGILLLNISRLLTEKLGWPPIRHYAVAFGGVVVLALVTEALQSLIPMRKPQVSDVIYDGVGAMCGLGWSITTDHSLSGKWAQWRTFPRRMFIPCGVGLVMAMTFLPVVEWAYAYWDRANRFPSLLQFSSPWEMKFVTGSEIDVQIVPPPVGWGKSADDRVGQVVFHTKRYPRIGIAEPYPDWNGYSLFHVDIFSELPIPRPIAFRIEDQYRTYRYEDGFNKTVTIFPGLNQIQIPLDEIRLGPVGREMDLTAIKAVVLFARSPSEEFTLFLDNIHLK
jgi:hypothetical protein